MYMLYNFILLKTFMITGLQTMRKSLRNQVENKRNINTYLHALASFLFDDAIIQYIESSVLAFEVSDKKQKMKCKISCQTASESIHIILRCQGAVRSLVLIVLHFRVHIVDGSDSQKIHLSDLHTKLHRP